MHAEYSRINHRSKWEKIEQLHKLSPDKRASILADTLCLKTIGLSDLSGLVVASDQSKSAGIPQL